MEIIPSILFVNVYKPLGLIQCPSQGPLGRTKKTYGYLLLIHWFPNTARIHLLV